MYRSFDLVNPIPQIKIGDEVYKDVYVFNENAADTTVRVTQVMFNKQYGIIKYMNRDCSVYVLDRQEALTEATKPGDTHSQDL
jgi:hypothetical protein